MRKGLFLGALLASVLVAGTAMADRTEQDERGSRGRAMKERVLEKQREGFGKVKVERSSAAKAQKTLDNRMERVRPKGDTYGDQAARSSGQSRMSAASGKNMSASNSANNPSEIAAMVRMINPMYGAYRTSQANEGTDSYGAGGSKFAMYNKAQRMQNGKARNMSAAGATNTPIEIQRMLRMFGPGAASQAGGSPGSTDSYGGGNQPTNLDNFKAGIYGSGFNRAAAKTYSEAQKNRVSERASKAVKKVETKNAVEKSSKLAH